MSGRSTRTRLPPLPLESPRVARLPEDGPARHFPCAVAGTSPPAARGISDPSLAASSGPVRSSRDPRASRSLSFSPWRVDGQALSWRLDGQALSWRLDGQALSWRLDGPVSCCSRQPHPPQPIALLVAASAVLIPRARFSRAPPPQSGERARWSAVVCPTRKPQLPSSSSISCRNVARSYWPGAVASVGSTGA